LRHSLGLGDTEIGGLEDRAQYTFGGKRIFAGKFGNRVVLADRQHKQARI
jgi:hypothetical protein